MDDERTPSTKERIEAAALGLFVRVGVDAATTREIAAEAGISEGALYRHYRSKDALAVALFMSVHRRLAELVEEAAAGERDIRAKAAAIVAAYCQVADENWTLFTFHMLSINRFIPYYQEDGRDPVSVVEKLLKQAMITVEIPPADPSVLASMVIGVVLQTAQNKAYRRIEAPLSAHAPAMTKAVQAILFAR
jgi:AcrR family transcriptional regulator